MKINLILGLFILFTSNVFAIDFKGKLLEAAKDKKNQDQAKEIAKKGMDYIKSDKKEEVKSEVVPAPAPTLAPTPVVEKEKVAKVRKKTKKKKKIKETKTP